ncbi:MAG TPA: histidine kinase [Gaiellaceae bacterium]|nr:histidine kinase [Gaiellaceae bacterium]
MCPRFLPGGYQAWLASELALFGLLAGGSAALAASGALHTAYELPELRLVIRTTIMLAGFVVALLAGARFAADGRRSDLLLSCGFFTGALGITLFSIGPSVAGRELGTTEAWALLASRLLAAALVAAAPFVSGRMTRRRSLLVDLVACAAILLSFWTIAGSLAPLLPSLVEPAAPPAALVVALALQAVLALIAVLGFGFRYRRHGRDLDRWLAFGVTFLLFTSLLYVFTPVAPAAVVSPGDFFQLLGYGVLLVGVWRAIRAAEFGRAVAEERARVAREIHDGLAQYLFAVSTLTSMLESGVSDDATISQLKEAAALAQQEARFAVLALSSASGNAPFDAALRRYVEFLTADGSLDVEVEIDTGMTLAPDEQIEVFRIVQEGLANVRRHAGARHAEVRIGHDSGRRFVHVWDDGLGFDPSAGGAGQGLKNIRRRAESIEGAFVLRTTPGRGTALEVVLRS